MNTSISKSYNTETYRNLCRKELNSFRDDLNELFSPYGYEFGVNMNHVIDRMKERYVDLVELREFLNLIRQRCMCRAAYLLENGYIRINFSYKDIMLCLGKKNEKRYLITTIMRDPRSFNERLTVQVESFGSFR